MIRSVMVMVALGAGGMAQADVTVTFRDGAPTDRVTVAALAPLCASGPLAVSIDLAGSAAGLILDVTGAGAGVEVFQPLVLVSGGDQVMRMTAPQDGDTRLDMTLSGLAPERPVAFTLDLDDTMGGREITVTGAEIAGAVVTLSGETQQVSAPFGTDGVAVLAMPGCHS